jgi:hypothetical protein
VAHAGHGSILAEEISPSHVLTDLYPHPGLEAVEVVADERYARDRRTGLDGLSRCAGQRHVEPATNPVERHGDGGPGLGARAGVAARVRPSPRRTHARAQLEVQRPLRIVTRGDPWHDRPHLARQAVDLREDDPVCELSVMIDHLLTPGIGLRGPSGGGGRASRIQIGPIPCVQNRS